MITIEELIEKLDEDFYKKNSYYESLTSPETFAKRVALEFARLHVQQALKNAYDCHTFKGWTNSEDENVHKELFVKNIMSRQQIL
jgi:hypothetical protein